MEATGPHADAQNMARFALELLDDVNKIRPDVNGAAQISVRVGIHTSKWQGSDRLCCFITFLISVFELVDFKGVTV